jgi:hypothetical protein
VESRRSKVLEREAPPRLLRTINKGFTEHASCLLVARKKETHLLSPACVKRCVVTPSVGALQRLTISPSGAARAAAVRGGRRVLVLVFVSRVRGNRASGFLLAKTFVDVPSLISLDDLLLCSLSFLNSSHVLPAQPRNVISPPLHNIFTHTGRRRCGPERRANQPVNHRKG